MTECADYLREVTYTQLLAGEYRGHFVNVLISAARNGHDAMIDLLVERYGVDPNGADDEYRRTALHRAAYYGRVRTVKHLVDKHNVDIQKRDGCGETALELAERRRRTKCAAVLRGYGAKTGEELEEEDEDSTESDDDWDSDDSDNSDAADDVMLALDRLVARERLEDNNNIDEFVL